MRLDRLAACLKVSICLLAAVHCGAAIAADADSGLAPAAESSAAGAEDTPEGTPEEGTLSELEIGREALLAKDYATAYRLLRNAAEQGDAQAQTALGAMYLAG